MRAAFALRIFSGIGFFIRDSEKPAGFSESPFHGRENSLSQSLTALPAPSGREPLAKPETLYFNWELYRNAKGPISEGAVERMRDWGSSLVYSTSSSSLR